MNSKAFSLAIISLGLSLASLADAATPWSTQDYDLYSGDFNGDGKTDILYIAKDAAKPSGIAVSDGSGPNIAWQSWASNFLGIQWYGSQYVAVVGDFNHDGKADVLLQRVTPGDNYLLLADATGRLVAISQTISNSALGLSWSKDKHTILAGDFNGDGRADLFFQAATPSDTNAIVLADTSGTFTTGPSQTWTDGSWSAFKWSTKNAVISVGNFNSDTTADLLVQRKPNVLMIDYDVAIPVMTYAPGSFGIAYSPFGSSGYLLWNRKRAGVDWSAANSNLIIGDFNGDGRVDVIVQSKRAGGTTSVVWGNPTTNQLNLDSPTTLTFYGAGSATGDAYRILAVNVTGSSTGSGAYLQATSSGGTDLIAATIPTYSGQAATTALNHAIETINYRYDARGRLIRVVHNGTVNSSLQTQYTYDKANNRKTNVTTGSPNP